MARFAGYRSWAVKLFFKNTIIKIVILRMASSTWEIKPWKILNSSFMSLKTF